MVLTAHNGSGIVVCTMDAKTNALNTIDYAHHEIHEGCAFHAHWSNDVSDTNFRTALTFKTANTTKWAHMIVSVHASDAAIAYIYEDILIDSGAAGEPAAISIRNRDRNNVTDTSGFISQHATPVTGGLSAWTEAKLEDGAVGGDGPWVVSTAIELDKFPLGGATNPVNSIGGSERGVSEFILKQNSVYMVMIQSLNANDNTHVIRLDWYEHLNEA
jgi:hypothetical protein